MFQDLIMMPMGALAVLTFVVLFFAPVQRFRVKGSMIDTPESASLPSRNHASLLEMPVLFYVVCLMAYVTGQVNQNMLFLAWAYVILRVLHSAIQLTYNGGLHRLAIFALSNLVLIVMWVLFFFNG
jgi:hypothetical protein